MGEGLGRLVEDQSSLSLLHLDGEVNAATLVDHFWPHRGNHEVFWDFRYLDRKLRRMS
jgi:hypothetical protein